jgi:hypothetical protein
MRDFLLSTAALIISVLAIPKLLQISQSWQLNTQAVLTAQVAKELAEATQHYLSVTNPSIASNHSTVLTISDLIAGGYLPASRTGCTRFGCQWAMEVTSPMPHVYRALVFSQFAEPLADRVGFMIASNVGAKGGLVPQNDSGVIAGQARCRSGDNRQNTSAVAVSWRQDLHNFTAARCGQVAILVDVDNTNADDAFIHRDAVAGAPLLNTMATPLILAAVRQVNDPCNQQDGFGAYPEPTGAISTDLTGAVIYCDGHHWTLAGGGLWKSPASSAFNTLPASGNAVGDTRLTSDTGRAFTWNGSAWQPLALDQNGNLTIPGAPGVGSTLTMNAKVAGATLISANGNAGDLSVSSAASINSPSFQTGGAGIRIGAVFQTGSNCAQAWSGQIANGDSATSGLLVSCQGGVWQPIGNRLQYQGFNTFTGSISGLNLTCPGNATALLQVIPTSLTVSGQQGAQWSYSVSPSPASQPAGYLGPFSVQLLLNNQPDSLDSAIVQKFCSYQ